MKPLFENKNNGFTLIEVMVALTIIAISLGALLSASGTQANSVTYLKEKTLAHIQAGSGKHFDPQVVEVFLE